MPVAYATYLGKTFWPGHLCALYPLPGKPPVLAAVVAVLVLAAITVLAVASRRRFPWLAVGWFWFLGTMVPVIGFIQVGGQALADRYTYIPSIGLLIMAAWSVKYWIMRQPSARAPACAAAGLCVLACAAATERQLPYWRDSRAFFSRILLFTPDSALAENGLGLALAKAGQRQEAIAHYQAALRLDPRSVKAHYNLGIEWAEAGKLDEAMSEFSEALKLNPGNEQLRNNVGVVLAREGKIEPALQQFARSIELNPQYPKPYFNSAMSLEKLGRFAQAAANYRKALQLEPDWPDALDRFALLLAACPESSLRNPALSLKLAAKANELTLSARPDYLRTLAAAYASAGQFTNAAAAAESARQRALSGGQPALAAKISADLQCYRAGRLAPVWGE
jgi:tetratricopeptide (TPR) repeat protein